VITRHLSTPLAAALAEADAAFAAASAPFEDERWVLPPGDHALTGPLALGRPGRVLTLAGPGAGECALVLSGGALALEGDTLAVTGVHVSATTAAAALTLTSTTSARLEGVRVSCSAAGDGACVALDVAGGDGAVELDDVEVDGVHGGDVLGARLVAAEVRVTGLTALQLVASNSSTGISLRAGSAELTDVKVEEVSGLLGAAVGLAVGGATRVDLAGVDVRGLSGEGVLGVWLAVGPGEAGVSLVDVEVQGLRGGTGPARGALLATAGALRLRGFSVRDLQGASACGLLALAGDGLELALGQVENLVGGAAGAVGVRALATPSLAPVIVRDVAVARVAAAPVPTDARPPRDGEGKPVWQGWAAQVVGLLASGVALDPAGLPALPGGAGEVAGVHIDALVDELAPLLDRGAPGVVRVEDGALRTISGSALALDGGLRTALVRRLELSTNLFAGWLQADELLLAELTCHRHQRGLHFGPGELRAYDSIFSALALGRPFVLDEDTDVAAAQALFAGGGVGTPFLELGPLPYEQGGAAELPAELLAGTLPAPEVLDLRLRSDAAIARSAVKVPGDAEDAPVFLGAYPPPREHRCELRDPQPRPFVVAVEPPVTPTQVDYRARDAKSLLAVMLERARVAMAPWVDRGPADFTTMLFEALADRLDHLAYQQESAVSEGFLADARLRRSVEDHARALDYQPDPGLSASVMLRFRIDPEALDELVAAQLAALHLDELPPGTSPLELLTEGGVFELPADTLVANASSLEESVVFATDEPLAFFPELDELRLVDDVLPGATEMQLAGVLPRLEPGRWLLLHRGRGEAGHVVRATIVERGADHTRVAWDPRRPAPVRFAAAADAEAGTSAAVVLGNVVPAQHGLPLSAAGEQRPAAEANAEPELLEPFEASLLPWQKPLLPTLDGSVERELELPYHPISRQAPGYPFPGELRQGSPALGVSVEDDPWTLADDLSACGPGDERFVLRAGADGGEAIRFGNGVNGAALPARDTQLQLELRVGLGKIGNVGESVLNRLLHVPRPERAIGPIWESRQLMELLRRLVRADNPLPAVGGREPESLEQIRYRAPFGVSQGLSAVTADDYVKRVTGLAEVAGASARVTQLGIRQVVRVTVLLRDVDELMADEALRDELLRRWALVRSALERARLLGFDVVTAPPTWVPLDLDLVVDAQPYAQADLLQDAVIDALAGPGGLFDPDVTGLGGDVHLADLYRAVTRVQGVAGTRALRFRRLAPDAPERLEDGVIAIGPEEVATVRGRGPRVAGRADGPGTQGILTVTVCGGLR
jgi:hypothetical protein